MLRQNLGDQARDRSDVWDNKGASLGNLGIFEDGLECFGKALDLAPKNIGAWCNRGAPALGGLGNYEEALRYFNQALEIKPDFEEARIEKGRALIRLGKIKEAEDILFQQGM